MSAELIITAVATFIAGLVTKIVFDWFKGGRKKNPGNNANPGTSTILTEINGMYSLLEEMVTELKGIKETVLWSKQIQNSIDPVTGQPRWYNTGLVTEIQGMRKSLDDSLRLERKNRELLLSVLTRARDGTDPNIGGT